MTEIHQRIEAEIPRLRRYARVLVRDVTGADDLVQECLTRALSKLDLWREGTNLRAWLFTVMHNQYVNHVRRSFRTGTLVEFDDESAPALSRPAHQEKRLELRDLDRALARLPQEQRAVILLVGLEGMPYADVAMVLGVPVGTVRSRLSRGRSTLRQLMDMGPHAECDERASTGTPAGKNATDEARGNCRLAGRAAGCPAFPGSGGRQRRKMRRSSASISGITGNS